MPGTELRVSEHQALGLSLNNQPSPVTTVTHYDLRDIIFEQQYIRTYFSLFLKNFPIIMKSQ